MLIGISGQPLTIDNELDFVFRRLSNLGRYGGAESSVATLPDLVEVGRIDLSGSVTATLPLSEAEHAVGLLQTKRRAIRCESCCCRKPSDQVA